MSNMVGSDKPVVQSPEPAPEDSGSSRLQTVVIVVIALGAAALMAYQFLACATCYAPI